ncbi:MAG: heavy metal translocating P-type ATPase [Gemmatimonadota bacterium]
MSANRGPARERGGELVLHVHAMDCPDCVRRISDRLHGLEGVREAAGNPVSRRLRVRFDPDRLEAARIRTEVGKLGYSAREVDENGGRLSAPSALLVWRAPEALRTYASLSLFGVAFLFRLLGWTPAVLALPSGGVRLPEVLYVIAAGIGGWNFFPAGLRAARARSLDMNFLMTVAILGAVGIGAYPEAAAIAFLFSLAELLESYSVDRARRSIESLMRLAPQTAVVLRDGEEVTVAADELHAGDMVLVRPGERIPADGRVREGESWVDQGTITGESMPVGKHPGDEVFAGTIAGEGWLRVEVERAADQTTFARILRLVEQAETRRAPTERFVERFARYYTPVVTVSALIVMLLPPLVWGAPFATWFVRGLTLLVIACPCALVISTPVAVVSGITAAARNGVLIKGGAHLEAMGGVRAVAFDKTATLTRGHAEVTDIVPLNGAEEANVLAVAAAVEARSEHPLATAILQAAESRGLEPRWQVTEFEALRGRGVRARLDGVTYQVGAPALFEPSGGRPELLRSLRGQGKTVVLVGRPEAPLGVIAVGDRPREAAAEAIRDLKSAGIRRTVLLTGDNRETARAIAAELGIDEVHAELLPDEKAERIRVLERTYGPVAMVGDGVNDAPALAAATVGIAMGVAGSDTALETADIALMGDRLSRLAYVCRLSRRGRAVIRQNIGVALAVKFTLAAGVPFGLVSLILAVLLGDMGTSLGVTFNSLRLARIRSQ